MKKEFTCWFLVVFCFSFLSAQNYHPFLTDSVQWNYVITAYGVSSPGVYQKTTVSKTLGVATVQNTTYRVIYHDVALGSWNTSNDNLYLVREDSLEKKVYLLQDGQEVLLYDFTLEVGDHFPVEFLQGYFYLQGNESHNFEVAAIDTVNTPAGLRRQWTLTHPDLPDDPEFKMKWIEGLGSIISPIYTEEFYGYDAEVYLQCAFQNDKQIYARNHPDICIVNSDPNTNTTEPGKLELRIYPNPTTGKFTIEPGKFPANSALRIYQVDGTLLEDRVFPGAHVDISHLPPGAYVLEIVNHKGLILHRQLLLRQ